MCVCEKPRKTFMSKRTDVSLFKHFKRLAMTLIIENRVDVKTMLHDEPRVRIELSVMMFRLKPSQEYLNSGSEIKALSIHQIIVVGTC